MLYRIDLKDMEFRAYHGCYDLEQKVGNRFRVQLTIWTELGEGAREDDVTKLISYLEVYEQVREVMGITQRTIESVACNIIECLKERFGAIEEVECTVAKLAPPLGGKLREVSVTIKA